MTDTSATVTTAARGGVVAIKGTIDGRRGR
jgi:hypothetical protein